MELYKKHRPKLLKDLVGQEGLIKSVSAMTEKKNTPHSILLTGPSGCGKTTIARILRRAVKCHKNDLNEMDCADFRGIDMVREIKSHLHKAPIGGKSRVWIIDECHKLTNDAQNAFLKILEDTPSHVYFFLATTEPEKLKNTIRTRCTQLAVRSLTNKQITSLLEGVCKKEEIALPEDARDAIILHSDGSARKALVLLEQVRHLEEDDMIEAIESTTAKDTQTNLVRLLMNPRSKWPEVAKAVKEVPTEDAERVRRGVLGYARAILLSGGKMSERAYLVIDTFRDNYYDTGNAGLAASCYELVTGAS